MTLFLAILAGVAVACFVIAGAVAVLSAMIDEIDLGDNPFRWH